MACDSSRKLNGEARVFEESYSTGLLVMCKEPLFHTHTHTRTHIFSPVS